MTDTKQIIKQFLQGYKITIKNVEGNPFKNALGITKQCQGEAQRMEGAQEVKA
jgi:glycerol-3-phosphate O-acyltransferase